MGKSDKLDPNKVKGLFNKKTPKLWVQFRLQFDCVEPSRTPKCNDAPRRAKRAMMMIKVLYFIYLQRGKAWNLVVMHRYLPVHHFPHPCQADGCWMLMECSWTTVMTVRSDGCTRRHMSVLRSSNVRLKLLLCVNKEDRKWQFGSSNQECHSQLRPLPAPDTSRGLKRSRAWLLFFCHPLPFLPSTPRPVFAGNSVSLPPTRHVTEDRMMYGRHEAKRRQHIFWILQ